MKTTRLRKCCVSPLAYIAGLTAFEKRRSAVLDYSLYVRFKVRQCASDMRSHSGLSGSAIASLIVLKHPIHSHREGHQSDVNTGYTRRSGWSFAAFEWFLKQTSNWPMRSAYAASPAIWFAQNEFRKPGWEDYLKKDVGRECGTVITMVVDV